ncbi:MAG TPA: helix-turn-helix transcriptional regulator [Polyangiaceae bacterium]|nr:helix-turn-helix transcriptional regulator [Polyangiaceae bacterium]
MFASTERVELASIWDELTAGTCKVESWSHGENTWEMVLTRRPTPAHVHHGGLRPRDVEILEQALLCGVRKHVAVEAGLSCSSIAVILQGCFQFMGLDCLPSRIPGLLVAAAHARHHHQGKRTSALRRSPSAAQQTIRIPRPDLALAAWLAPAEHTVITLLIEGHGYAEIAQARHTSIRTVANQVASAFRRLGVSGRAELLCLLARWGLEPPQPPARRPPSVLPSSARRAISRGIRLLEDGNSRPHLHSPSPAT